MNLDDRPLLAWQAVDPPALSTITDHECDECDEIRDFFAGRPWTDFADVEALSHHRDAMHLFGSSAYHYYLPAFLRATLHDPVAADCIPDTIVYTIEGEFGVASRGRLALFSPEQRGVLAGFLRAMGALDLVEAEQVGVLADLLDDSHDSRDREPGVTRTV